MPEESKSRQLQPVVFMQDAATAQASSAHPSMSQGNPSFKDYVRKNVSPQPPTEDQLAFRRYNQAPNTPSVVEVTEQGPELFTAPEDDVPEL